MGCGWGRFSRGAECLARCRWDGQSWPAWKLDVAMVFARSGGGFGPTDGHADAYGNRWEIARQTGGWHYRAEDRGGARGRQEDFWNLNRVSCLISCDGT